ncbi:MAG: hypothetical protein LBH32_09870 [Dysgonamonadaceae bacterium]|nr:hypothetical protein [Dysgonamonadaceae bacterium]
MKNTEFYNITLADLGSFCKAEPEKLGSRKIRIDFEADAQRSELVDDEGAKLF